MIVGSKIKLAHAATRLLLLLSILIQVSSLMSALRQRRWKGFEGTEIKVIRLFIDSFLLR